MLDLDFTLVFCTTVKPGDMFNTSMTQKESSAQANTEILPDYLTVLNKEYGSGEIYVYKRPHLREFLLKVAQLG